MLHRATTEQSSVVDAALQQRLCSRKRAEARQSTLSACGPTAHADAVAALADGRICHSTVESALLCYGVRDASAGGFLLSVRRSSDTIPTLCITEMPALAFAHVYAGMLHPS